MAITKQGTNIAATSVDLYAHCGRSQFYAPVTSGANLQVCSPIALVKQVPVQVQLKAEGGGVLRAGGTLGYRLPKALDYANEFWFITSVSAVKYTGPAGSFARFRHNWLLYLFKRARVTVQDLQLLEVDHTCAVFYLQNYIGHHQREAVDCLMGNTAEFLSKVEGNGNMNGPLFGSTRAVAMPLPIYAKMLGSYGSSLVHGSMLLSEVLIEIELNPIQHIFEVINAPCCASSGAANCGSVGQIFTCNNDCPEVLGACVFALGAIGTPEEKKYLAKHVYSSPIKTFNNGYVQEVSGGSIEAQLRVSLATTALHIGIFNITESIYSDVSSTILGGYGVSPIECVTLNYDGTTRHESDVVLSKIGLLGFSDAPGVFDSYTVTIPLSFNMTSACFSQATEFARIANAFIDVKLTDEARLAMEGKDQFGNAISNTDNCELNAAGQLATPATGGVNQRFQLRLCTATLLPVKYVSSRVSLTI